MAVVVIDTIKPKNNGTFPVVEAADVKVTDSKRLDAALNDKANQSDLTALQTTVAGKASQSDLTALSNTVSNKADKSALAETNAAVAGKQNALTEEQLTAVNSGITSELVTQIGTNTTAIEGKASAADLAETNAAVAAKADASDVTAATTDLQAQIDALVTPVTQDAEVENARVGVSGTTYTTLKQRLDTEETSNISNDKWSQNNISDLHFTIYSKNIFNVEAFTEDAERDGATGEIKPNASHYGVSDVFSVESGKTLYFSYDGSALAPTFIYLYKKDGTYDSRISGATTYLVPNDCGYISICFPNNKADKYQTEYGSVTSFVKYGIIIDDAKFENIQSQINDINSYLLSKNLFDKAEFTLDAERDSSTGEIKPNASSYGVSNIFAVVSGQTLYFSYNGSALAPTYIYTYQKDGTFISRIPGTDTYVLPSNCGFISVCFPNNKADKYQVEYGAVSAYQNYRDLSKEIAKTENEVKKIDEAVFSRNLFDLSQFIKDSERDQTTGEIIANANYYGVSGIFPVTSGKTVYFSKNGVATSPTFIYTYAKDGTYIKRSSGTNTFQVGANCGFISICMLDNDAKDFQAEYDAVTAYDDFRNASGYAAFEIMASVNMFGSIAGIGDSYTAGLSASRSSSAQDMREQSYIATMGKRAGVDWYNYGVSGATSKSYNTDANGLPKVLAADPHDFYIFALGQNDVNVGTTVGTIDDIHDDWTLNADTFYGNYGKIITQVLNHAPNAKMVIVKSWLNTKKYGTDISYQKLDGAIEEIANYYHIPCIAPFDDEFFNSRNYQSYRIQGHPTTMGYCMMGIAMERLFSKCVVRNPEYFLYSTIG